MNFKVLLTGAVMALSFGASAQTWVTDSVTMNAGYANDVYYSLQNGTVATPVNGNWHLAFQMTPPGPYGNVSIVANHVQSGVQVYNLHMAASTSFNTLQASDTVGKTAPSMQLYNADTNWNYGAFNRTVEAGNPYNYSWGTYDMNGGVHNVNGDSIYLLKVANMAGPVIYKLHIKQYMAFPADSIKWKFRIAKFDGTEDTSIIIRPADYPNKLFAYYNVTNRTVTDREPVKTTWDLMFGRYKGEVSQGGQTAVSNLTGVLSNFGVTVADVRGVNADTATMYGRTFSRKMNEIGYDWKINVPMTANYYMDSTATFFVKTAATPAMYWQMQFTGFSAANGRSTFRKRAIVPTSIKTVNNSLSNYYAAPNPANNSVALMLDTKESTEAATLALTDMSGRTVSVQTISVAKGINTFTLQTAHVPAGMYLLSVTGNNIRLSQKLNVAH